MELPQPRQFGAEGRKTTHDFLSLYSPVQQDPRPSQGSYLKTHDFLQPLEGIGKNGTKEENNLEVTVVEKPPPPAPPPPPPSVTHILPGGIGTYSISYFEQRVPKPEGGFFAAAAAAAPVSSAERNDENSNCSSYTGSGFTLFEESAAKKGKTGKENIAGDKHILREATGNLGGGQWTTSVERPSQSSSSHKHNSTALSSLSSSQPPSNQKKYSSFMDMITSSKMAQEEEEDEEDEEFNAKKEASSHPKGNLSVKVDGKGTDQKPNTPRSKHSATEQRRRSKINDRFQRLREIIPHSDQKRDKASFLLEVIDYIQYLQEKVHRYEGPYQGWNQEPSKLMPWGNCYRTGEGFADQPQCTNSGSGQALMFAAKMDESKAGLSPANPINGQNLADSNISTIAAPKERCQTLEITNKAAAAYPPQLQQKQQVFPFRGTSSTAAAPISPAVTMEINKTAAAHLQSHFQPRSCPADTAVASDHKLKEQKQAIESGSISISSAYSQGLLNSLTQALQNSGVDLTQASISVQIDLGKRTKSRLYSSISAPKDDGVPMSNQPLSRPITMGTGEESDQALKRLKTGRS